eukprot:gene9852-20491_t
MFVFRSFAFTKYSLIKFGRSDKSKIVSCYPCVKSRFLSNSTFRSRPRNIYQTKDDIESEQWMNIQKSLLSTLKRKLVLLRGSMVRMRRIVINIPFIGTSFPVIFTLSNMAGHGAFLCLALSYLETDFFSLRMYAASGIFLSILFQYYREKPLWIPIKWNGLFLAINCVMLSLLVLESREAQNILPEDKLLFELAFQNHGMSPADFLHLMQKAKKQDFSRGEKLIVQGEWHNHLYVVMKGSLSVSRDHKFDYHLNQYQFVGEMSFLSWKDIFDRDHAGYHSYHSQHMSLLGRLFYDNMHYIHDTEHHHHNHNNNTNNINNTSNTNNNNNHSATVPDSSEYGISGSADVTCDEDCVVYCWSFQDLHDMLQRDKKFSSVFERCLSADLFKKMKEKWVQEPLVRFRLMLAVSLIDGEISPRERSQLSLFRREYGISDRDYSQMLGELGWTLRDMEAGYKGSEVLEQYRNMLHKELKTGKVSVEAKNRLRVYRENKGINFRTHLDLLSDVPVPPSSSSLPMYNSGSGSGGG